MEQEFDKRTVFDLGGLTTLEVARDLFRASGSKLFTGQTAAEAVAALMEGMDFSEEAREKFAKGKKVR